MKCGNSSSACSGQVASTSHQISWPPERHEATVSERARVAPEGGERDAAFLRVVATVDQEASHGQTEAAQAQGVDDDAHARERHRGGRPAAPCTVRPARVVALSPPELEAENVAVEADRRGHVGDEQLDAKARGPHDSRCERTLTTRPDGSRTMKRRTPRREHRRSRAHDVLARMLDVARDGLPAGGLDVPGVRPVADERAHVVAALVQQAGQAQCDLPVSARDDDVSSTMRSSRGNGQAPRDADHQRPRGAGRRRPGEPVTGDAAKVALPRP